MEIKQSIEATCPDCRGPLSEIKEEERCEYRCLVGHAYSPRTLLQAHSETQEKMLWAAVVALEESANLVGLISPQLTPAVAQRLHEQVVKKQSQARELRQILENLEVFETW